MAALRWRHACLQRLKHRVGDLAEDVELQLPGGVIADPHRRRVLVSGQPRDDQLRQPPLSTHPVHDLDLARTAGDRPNKPIAPCLRLLVVAEIHEGQQRERGIAQPAITIIPVPHAAETLGKRRCGCGDDPPGRGVGQGLQRDERAFDRFRPRPDIGTAIAPLRARTLPCASSASKGSIAGGGF